MGKDPELAALMLRGWCKPGQAEQIISSAGRHKIFREWFDAQRENRVGDSTAAD